VQLGTARLDRVLLGCVAVGAAAALPVTGALLTGALLVVPAATARMLTDRAARIPLLSFVLAAVTGVAGLELALTLELPAGAAIAAVSGAGFFLTAAIRTLMRPRGALRPVAGILPAALAALLLAGCSQPAPSADDAPLEVVATTAPVADIVKQVGGEAVAVTTLLPPGADPHRFDPGPQAARAITSAGVVFRSGGDLDSWLVPAVAAAHAPAAPVDLSRSAILLAGEGPSGFNAHWYLDPQNVARAAQRVRDELIKAEPTARETFRTNTTAYLDRIDATDRQVIACARRIDRQDRSLASGNDDFSYLARAAGLRLVVVGGGTGGTGERRAAARSGLPLIALDADSAPAGDRATDLLAAIRADIARIAGAASGGRVSCAVAR
jgi:ABC-type Zn uptake system ZnuABC Zn-binding protein ZnuA